MKIKTIKGENTLIADDNKWLTNEETYVKMVTIGKNDSLLNWREVNEIPNEPEKESEE